VPPKEEEEEDHLSVEEDGEAEETEENYDEEDDYVDVTKDLDAPRYVVPLPDRLKTDIHYGLDGSVTGSLWLDPSVFGIDPIRVDLIKQSVDYIRNKIRGRRKAKSKTISEKSGSGRKVRQQKGTGRARAGHSRPAHWRGGAKAHGPKNATDYGNVKMNKKARRLAMVSTLSQKLKEGNLIVIDNLHLESHKTSQWSALLESAFGIGKEGSSALILDHYYEPEQADGDDSSTSHASYNGVPINLWVASSNLYKIKVANQRFMNIYDILKKDKLVLTLGALEQMESRWKD
jgi:large subunit ribosomal protein L4